MPSTDEEAFHSLSAYTVTLGDPAFTHQHVVDAYAAQTADAATKPVKITFALVGLFLLLERGFSGKAVQDAHMKLARQNRKWPTFPLPPDRGGITAGDVLKAPEGPARERLIHAWCAEVWRAWSHTRGEIAALLTKYEVSP
jgi:hypothetical protein